MATYKLTVKKLLIEVEVSIPALNLASPNAHKDVEIVRVGNVREYLNGESISYGKALESTTITNRDGSAATALFVFEKTGTTAASKPKAVTVLKKDLTSGSEPAIIEKAPKKKRKPVKREHKSDSGNKTTS